MRIPDVGIRITSKLGKTLRDHEGKLDEESGYVSSDISNANIEWSKRVAQGDAVGAGITEHGPVLPGIAWCRQQLFKIILIQPVAGP